MSLQCHNLGSLFSMQIRILIERVWAGDKGRDRGISIGSGSSKAKGTPIGMSISTRVVGTAAM